MASVTAPRWAAPFLCLLVASGCGTLVRGTHQTVHVESIPSDVELRDARTGETWLAPADISLWRTRRHVLIASKPGYRSQEIYIRSEASAVWYYANIVTLFVGLAVDAVAGGLYDLAPERVTVVMEATSQTGGS